jgi:hypothetical protein
VTLNRCRSTCRYGIVTLLKEKDERLQELREQVHHFRQILTEERVARRRADTIIAQLTQRIPELPPASPQGHEDDPETATEEPEGDPREY